MKLDVISVVLLLCIYLLKIGTTNGQLEKTLEHQSFKLIQHFESGKCLNVYMRDHHGYGKFTDTDKKFSVGSSWLDWEKWWPTGGPAESEILKVHLGECPSKSEKSTVSNDDGDYRSDHHVVKANDINFTPFETQTFHLLSGTPDVLLGNCVYSDAENFYIVDANKCDPRNPTMLFSLIAIPEQIDIYQIIHTASGLCFQISDLLDGAAARLSSCDSADLLQWWRICDVFGRCSRSPSSPDKESEPVGPGEQRSVRKVRSAQARGSPGPAGPPGYPGSPGGPGTRGGQGGTGGSGGGGGTASGGAGGPGGPGGGCGSGGQGAPGGNGGASGPSNGGYPGSPGSPGSPGNPGSTGSPGAAGGPGSPGGHGLPGGPGGSGGPGGAGGQGGAGGGCLG